MAEFPEASDAIDRAKAVVTERAELPGMSLFEHLDELRKRLIHSALYLVGGVSGCGDLCPATVFADAGASKQDPYPAQLYASG